MVVVILVVAAAAEVVDSGDDDGASSSSSSSRRRRRRRRRRINHRSTSPLYGIPLPESSPLLSCVFFLCHMDFMIMMMMMMIIMMITTQERYSGMKEAEKRRSESARRDDFMCYTVDEVSRWYGVPLYWLGDALCSFGVPPPIKVSGRW